MAKERKSNRKTRAGSYLHGFSSKEQDRLYHQARFHEASVFEGVDFSGRDRIIEVGCGVGAQTEILLERFPRLHIDGIDASPAQIQRANKHLPKPIRDRKLTFQVADALHLPFADNSFDGAFVSWFLEHVKNPIEVLKEVRRVLKSTGVIYCNEVLNATFYVHPYSPATLQYWFAFNDHQWNLGGDPFVGAKLANYLSDAGYQNVETHTVVQHLDKRAPKRRAQYIEEWTSQLLSGAPELIEAGKVTEAVVQEMKNELHRLKDEPDSVFFNTFVKAKAQVL